MANLFWPRHPLRLQARSRRRRERKWVAAAQAAPENLVLSHGGCLDGIASAVVAQRSLPGVAVAYAQPSQVKTALDAFARSPGRGRRILIADLSLQPQDLPAIAASLARLKAQGWRIEWLDHHHKQWEGVDLAPITTHLDALVVDAEQLESGATLVQKRFAPDDEALRRLAETVRDRDLWWNKDPASETLEFALGELGAERMAQELARYDGGDVVSPRIAHAAAAQRRSQAQQGQRILKNTHYHGEPPHRVGIVYGWLPRNTGLHELLESHDCALAVNIRPNGKMSIRSRRGFDVSHKVAAAFGGGGHPNASGGDLGLHGLSYWTYVLRRGRNVQGRIAHVALRELEAAAQAAKAHADAPPPAAQVAAQEKVPQATPRARVKAEVTPKPTGRGAPARRKDAATAGAAKPTARKAAKKGTAAPKTAGAKRGKGKSPATTAKRTPARKGASKGPGSKGPGSQGPGRTGNTRPARSAKEPPRR